MTGLWVLSLLACMPDSLVGDWEGTCDFPDGTSWELSFSQSVDETRTVLGTGPWQLTTGPLFVDRIDEPPVMGSMDGFHCLGPEECTLDGIGEVPPGLAEFTYEATSPDDYLYLKGGTFGDQLEGVCDRKAGTWVFESGTYALSRVAG